MAFCTNPALYAEINTFLLNKGRPGRPDDRQYAVLITTLAKTRSKSGNVSSE